MSKNEYFDQALSGMKESFAGRDGIKHLADLGYSIRQIKESLDFPFTADAVGRVLWEHFVSNEKILLKAPGSGMGEADSTYVRKTDAYGKQSFIKVTEASKEEAQKTWTKVILKNEHDIFSAPFARNPKVIKDFISKNTSGGPDYVSLDFGRLKSRNSSEWVGLLSHLEADERDYVEIIPWEKNINNVYHLVDDRMIRILCQLEGSGFLPGVFYFAVKD